ncbi:MAG: glycosyltransferase family 2 protein [Bacteroidales bacterium]|nr:glycosyltransferase family 2 protein [Bacteroidales bacterium]
MNYAIVVPCYNEEAVLTETTSRLLEVMQRVAEKHADLQGRIVYVDDGSRDGTWPLIGSLSKQHPQVMGLKLAHNAGHQHALWAGLEWAAAHVDAAISIDADLQDDVNVIPEMIDCFLEGTDIVYGVRRDRPTDTWFKRTTALAFYKLMSKLGGDIVYNHADYRLMSRRTLAALMTYGERNLFLRGMVRTLGFPQAMVYYDRGERFAGESKYPLRKMLAFAIDGITSFSVRPLRLISIVGLSFMLVALAVIVYGLVAWLCGRTIQGWTSLLVSLWFIGGAILVALGVIGEYVGKIYAEVKRRPRYFIEETTE